MTIQRARTRPSVEEDRYEHPLVTNMDILCTLADMVNDEEYLFFALVSTGWRKAWAADRPRTTRTVSAHCTVSQLKYSFACGLRRTVGVCNAVARLGRVNTEATAAETQVLSQLVAECTTSTSSCVQFEERDRVYMNTPTLPPPDPSCSCSQGVMDAHIVKPNGNVLISG